MGMFHYQGARDFTFSMNINQFLDIPIYIYIYIYVCIPYDQLLWLKSNQLPGLPHKPISYFPLFVPLLSTPNQIGSQLVARQLLRPPKVYSIGWWMKHWGAKTPKRSKAFSNSPHIGKFHRGRLRRQDAIVADEDKTTVQYRDSQGRKRFTGTANLKGTQCLA